MPPCPVPALSTKVRVGAVVFYLYLDPSYLLSPTPTSRKQPNLFFLLSHFAVRPLSLLRLINNSPVEALEVYNQAKYRLPEENGHTHTWLLPNTNGSVATTPLPCYPTAQPRCIHLQDHTTWIEGRMASLIQGSTLRQ